MRVAITGGTGFLGRHIAQLLAAEGHEVVLVARGVGPRDAATMALATVRWERAGTGDAVALRRAFLGCEAIVHCAGINREHGAQTYRTVHVEGTRHVVEAARAAGVRRIVMVSFLRARPHCGSGYHESKYAAEEIVRHSGLDFAILKPGVIYGIGDHMLDHLSHALFTFPVFAFVGMHDRPVRPVAVADMARICCAAAVDGRLSGQTVAVLGPEQLLLGEAVRRVALVIGRRPLFVRAPVRAQMVLAWCAERLMTTPLISLAQVRILAEGVVEPAGVTAALPHDLAPATAFTEAAIRAGLPRPGRFRGADLRACVALRAVLGRS